MIRAIGQRLFASGLAALFLLAGNVEGYGLRDCPHHEQFGGTHAAAHSGHAPASDESAHRPSGGHAASPADSAGGSHDDPAPCSCLGACHAGATAPLVTDASGPELALPSDLRTHALRVEAARIFFVTPYLLPYATAPPAPRVSVS